MMKSALLLSTTIGLSIALASGGYAATKHMSTTTVANHGKQPKLTFSQGKVKGSVAGSGVYGSTSTTSVTNLDNESVNCKSKSGCVLEMSAMIQQCSLSGAFAANLYATQVLVDGNFVDNGPYAGGTSTSHVCDIQNWQGAYPVAAGSHTVTFDAYESSAAFIAQWSDRTDAVTQ